MSETMHSPAFVFGGPRFERKRCMELNLTLNSEIVQHGQFVQQRRDVLYANRCIRYSWVSQMATLLTLNCSMGIPCHRPTTAGCIFVKQ